jgi:hypothetical protein
VLVLVACSIRVDVVANVISEAASFPESDQNHFQLMTGLPSSRLSRCLKKKRNAATRSKKCPLAVFQIIDKEIAIGSSGQVFQRELEKAVSVGLVENGVDDQLMECRQTRNRADMDAGCCVAASLHKLASVVSSGRSPHGMVSDSVGALQIQ